MFFLFLKFGQLHFDLTGKEEMRELRSILENETISNQKTKTQLHFKLMVSVNKVNLLMLQVSEKHSELQELCSSLNKIIHAPSEFLGKVKSAQGIKNIEAVLYQIYFSSETDKDEDSLDEHA